MTDRFVLIARNIKQGVLLGRLRWRAAIRDGFVFFFFNKMFNRYPQRKKGKPKPFRRPVLINDAFRNTISRRAFKSSDTRFAYATSDISRGLRVPACVLSNPRRV